MNADYHRHSSGDVVQGAAERCIDPSAGAHDVRVLPQETWSALRALVSDWQANGNSRELGDPSADTWHACAEQLLRALDA